VEQVHDPEIAMDKLIRAALPALLALAALSSNVVRAEVNEHTVEGIVSDEEFVRRAWSVGNAEIQLGAVAKEQAMDSDVRVLADQLVADHGRSNNILFAIARDKHVSVSGDLDTVHKARLDALTTRTGTDFDRDYLEGVRVNQEAMVGLFQTESRTGNDPDVRLFATQHLPIMQAHAERTRLLQAALKSERR
jgi:putative membrane protein